MKRGDFEEVPRLAATTVGSRRPLRSVTSSAAGWVTARVAPTEAEQEVRRERADVGIGPYENIASTAMECVRRKEHPCTTRLARACASGQRMVAQRRYESKTVGLSVLVRAVKMFPHGLHSSRAKDFKTLVLAAFFRYFLPLLAESTPPEA